MTRRLVICFLLAHTAVAQEAFFMGLGDIPGGEVYSDARAVSADGSTVVGVSTDEFGFGGRGLPFRWNAQTGMRSLLEGSEFYSGGATGVSSDGNAITGFASRTDGTGGTFSWTAERAFILIGDLPGGPEESNAFAISADGTTIVGQGRTETSHLFEAFRWTESDGIVSLGDLPGSVRFSSATDVNADGSVIVGMSHSARGLEPFRWTPETGMIGLGFLDGGCSIAQAWAVSGDGRVIAGDGGDDQCAQVGFRWTAQTGMRSIEPRDGSGSQFSPRGVNFNGTVIVGNALFPRRAGGAAVWEPRFGTRSLKRVLEDNGINFDGWLLEFAEDVSDDGRTIVGTGLNPDGNTEGWIAYLGPATCADIDNDGLVGLSDLGILLSRFGTPTGATRADGDVDLDDLQRLLTDFGNGCI